MTDSDSLREQAHRGAEADRLLSNPLLKEAFDAIEAAADKMWKGSDAGDQEQRERAFYLYRALKQLKASMHSYVATGKLAHEQLTEAEKSNA